MVTDSSFWREKATEFERICGGNSRLGADYHPNGWGLEEFKALEDNCHDRWMLSDRSAPGASDPHAIEAFKSLAGLTAVAVGCPNAPPAWACWLDHLRRDSTDFISGFVLSRFAPDERPDADAKPIDVHLGEIEDLCGASARFCRQLANESEKQEIVGRTAPATTDPISEVAESDTHRHAVREAFVEPRLTAKGWSTLDWAQNAKVDYNTANDYVRGVTIPRADTRKKLADALGVPPEDMPD